MARLKEIYQNSLEVHQVLNQGSPSFLLIHDADSDEVFRLGEPLRFGESIKFPSKDMTDAIAKKVARTVANAGLLAFLVTGSIAYGLYYNYISKKGYPPNKEQLIKELEQKRFMDQLQLEHNQRLKDARTTIVNQKLIASIQDVTAEIDSIRGFNDHGYQESEEYHESVAGAVSKLARFGAKHGAQLASKLGPGLQRFGSVAKSGIQTLGRGANTFGDVAERVARPIITPSQVVVDSMRRSSNEAIRSAGHNLRQFGHAGQSRAFNAVVSLPGKGQGLQARAKAAGKLVAANVADKTIQGAAVGTAGTAIKLAQGKHEEPEGGKPQEPPGTTPGHSTAPQNTNQQNSQQNQSTGSAGPRPGPDYVMTFGKWKKRGEGSPAR